MLFDHAGKCIYRGSPFKAQEVIISTVEAAPSAILGGRKLETLASFNESLRNEATFGQVLRKASGLTSSNDAATAEEAKFVVEKLELHGRRMLENGLSMKESNPLGAAELMQRCSIAFKGSGIGVDAAKTLREWRKDREFLATLNAGQQLAKLQVLRADVLRSFGDGPSGEITPQMIAAIPPAMKQKMTEAIRGIQKASPGSETAAAAEKLVQEFGFDVSAKP